MHRLMREGTKDRFKKVGIVEAPVPLVVDLSKGIAIRRCVVSVNAIGVLVVVAHQVLVHHDHV
jgi:hypothetical protein